MAFILIADEVESGKDTKMLDSCLSLEGSGKMLCKDGHHLLQPASYLTILNGTVPVAMIFSTMCQVADADQRH